MMRLRNPPAGVTPAQADVLRYIKAFIQRTGYSPTMREISDALGRSYRSVEKSVIGLERRGRITREPHMPRSIRPVKGVD